MSVNVLAPSAGESVAEIEISQWNVADGSGVKKDQVVAMAETEKATLEVRSPVEGKLKILTPVGSVVSPGDPVASVEEGAVAETPSTSPPPTPISPTASTQEPEKKAEQPAPAGGSKGIPKEVTHVTQDKTASTGSNTSPAPVYASPSVRKMIVENNIDITQLQRSQGQDTIIGEEEVLAFLRQKSLLSNESGSGQSQAATATGRDTTSRKMTRLRQTIAKRLVEAQHNAALLTTFNEINMGAVMSIRNHYKELFKKKHEVGLGFMSFFVKAVCQALIEFPIINSRLEEDLVIEPNYADIGIAVATPKGLVVPVIRDAQSLNFKEIEEVILNYGKMGKDGSIPMDDLVGGTFTITNGGTFGSMLSTPIINPPQSAILGMHNIVERPVVENGEVVVRPVMYVALSYDHCLIDGADSVRFLYRIKEFIEDPNRLLVGV